VLSKQYMAPYTVQVYVVMDSNVLKNTYGIDLALMDATTMQVQTANSK
jgi:hypothetical protein